MAAAVPPFELLPEKGHSSRIATRRIAYITRAEPPLAI